MDLSQYVSKLNKMSQNKGVNPPEYRDLGSSGPDHMKIFKQQVYFDGKLYPAAEGNPKKNAKHKAAKNAYEVLMREQQEPAAAASTSAEVHYRDGVGNNKKDARKMAAKYALEGVFNDLPSETADDSALNQANNPSKITESISRLTITTEDNGFADTNFIGILNHYCQKKSIGRDYKLEKRCGPAHNPQFFYRVIIDGTEYPVAEGKSIKEARQKAAQLALSSLQVSIRSSEDLIPPVANVAAENANPDKGAVPDVVSPPIKQVVSPDAKPKIKLAASFHNLHRNQSLEVSRPDLGPDLAIKKDITPVEGTPQQPGNSRELSDDVAKPNSGSSFIQFEDSSPVQHCSSAQSPVMEKSTKKEVTTKTSSRFTSEYDNIQPIGNGSYGHVYKARKIEMETYCAIKEIKISNKLPEEKKKSLLEVKALYTFFHANIVRYYTSWIEDTGYSQVVKPNVQYLFIEMELCDGGTLRSWIHKKNNDPKESSRQQESLELAGQILNAVEYIHNKNLIHRDLKPENILFGGDGKVRIGDFGLVTIDRNDGEVVEKTEARGTKNYMAPEQFSTKYDRKVDIFALGMIFFELFWRMSTCHERQKILDNVRNQDFPKDFPKTYAVESRIIKTMLSKKPEDRPEASALKSEFEKLTQKEEIQQRTV